MKAGLTSAGGLALLSPKSGNIKWGFLLQAAVWFASAFLQGGRDALPPQAGLDYGSRSSRQPGWAAGASLGVSAGGGWARGRAEGRGGASQLGSTYVGGRDVGSPIGAPGDLGDLHALGGTCMSSHAAFALGHLKTW